MSKRFTDSEKWERPWFRALPIKMKLFWIFMCDKCDIAGFWYVDLELASFFVGEIVTQEEALSCLNKQVKVLNHGSRWQIIDFVPFQYGNLVPNNNLHRSVLSRLEKSGAEEGLVSPKAGDKVLVKVKVRVKDNIRPTLEEVQLYCKERNNRISPVAFHSFYEANGWVQGRGKPIKSWKACMITWELRGSGVDAPQKPSGTPQKAVKYEQVDPASRDKVAAMVRATAKAFKR